MALPILQREEWGFRACLEFERDACVHYEYAREYVRDRPHIARRLAGNSRIKLAQRLFASRFSKRQPRAYILPILCLQFPATPWLKVSRGDREELVSLCSPQPGEEPNPDLLTDENWELSCLQNFDEVRQKQREEWKRRAEEWAQTAGCVGGKKVPFEEMIAALPSSWFTPKHFYSYAGHIDYAVITLDWSLSNKDLRSAFNRLLKRRPDAFPDSGETTANRGVRRKRDFGSESRGGRGGVYDKLNQLSAWRLLRHYGDPEAVVDFLRQNASTLPYTSAVSIRVAARKARAALSKMEEEGQFSSFAARKR